MRTSRLRRGAGPGGRRTLREHGGLQGLRGFFTRDQRGAVVGVDRAGGLFTRVPADPP